LGEMARKKGRLILIDPWRIYLEKAKALGNVSYHAVGLDSNSQGPRGLKELWT